MVLGGMTGKLAASAEGWSRVSLRDYYQREELLIGNAVLTAEGAIGAAIAGHPGSINGARCLVTGFGRIGKALCLALRGLGAQVDCAARKAWDFTSIQALGCSPVSRQSPDCLLLELASLPGGIDLEAAGRLGLRVQQEPSLPGRMSPKSAGELIKETVYNMLEETEN